MGKVLTDAQKIAKLRCSLATKASQVIKNRHIDEYQEVYYSLLEEYGLAPSTKVKHMQVLWNENKKLKELLKEKGHEWNYPKPKEQEDNND